MNFPLLKELLFLFTELIAQKKGATNLLTGGIQQ